MRFLLCLVLTHEPHTQSCSRLLPLQLPGRGVGGAPHPALCTPSMTRARCQLRPARPTSDAHASQGHRFVLLPNVPAVGRVVRAGGGR